MLAVCRLFPTEVGRAASLWNATIDTAVTLQAVKPTDPERVIVDTAVQDKAIARAVESYLLELAGHKLIHVAQARRRSVQADRPGHELV